MDHGTRRDDGMIRSGYQLHRWTVLYEDEPVVRGSKVMRYWLCQCKCGTIKRVAHSSLLYDRTRSCGCIIKEMNRARLGKNKRYSNHPLYRSWLRCCRHGIADIWANDFERFCADMGPHPANRQTWIVSRIDPKKPHGPSNTVWKPKAEVISRSNRTRHMVAKTTMNLDEALTKSGRRFDEPGMLVTERGWRAA